MAEYSAYTFIYTIIATISLITFMPLFNFFGFSDALILLLATISQIATRIILGLATEEWMFYMGKLQLQHCLYSILIFVPYV